MQKSIFLMCLFFLSQKNFLQAQPDSLKTPDGLKYKNNKGLIFIKADQDAEFPGGAKKWIRYLEKNIDVNTPDKNGAPKGVYTIIAQFIVSKDGKIKSVSAKTQFGYGMEEELIRVITASPNWKPASQNGKNVNAFRRQSITFRANN